MSTTHQPRRPQVRLELEILEDRCVLSSSNYISGLYINLLHRIGGPAEVNFWVNVLDTSANPALVASEFVNSIEFRTNLVRFDYQALLHRSPTAQEIAPWLNALQHGFQEDALEAAILGSNEYFALHGATPASWLVAVSNDALAQQIPPTTLNVTNPALNLANFRFQTAYGLVISGQAHTLVVTTDYRQLLLRDPDVVGTAFWANRLDQTGFPSQVLVGLVSSPEYIGLTSLGGLDFLPVPPISRFGISGPTVSISTLDPFAGTNLDGPPLVITPFGFNPIVGTSLGGNNLFQATLNNNALLV
jgi:hypothetical protein